jgi:hypothetical protein
MLFPVACPLVDDVADMELQDRSASSGIAVTTTDILRKKLLFISDTELLTMNCPMAPDMWEKL